MLLWFLRLPTLAVWHASWGKTCKLHTSLLKRQLLRGNDPDHDFCNCWRELQTQTVLSFRRKREPRSAEILKKETIQALLSQKGQREAEDRLHEIIEVPARPKPPLTLLRTILMWWCGHLLPCLLPRNQSIIAFKKAEQPLSSGEQQYLWAGSAPKQKPSLSFGGRSAGNYHSKNYSNSFLE